MTARVAAVLALAGSIAAAQVRLVVSSQAGDRLKEYPPVEFTAKAPAGLPVIAIDSTVRFQTIEGFGATFNEAGLMVLNKLPKSAQEKTLESLFDAGRGAGFTLMKAPLAACDFAAAGLWYTYDDVPQDVKLERFSIARDLRADGQLTFIRRAQKYGRFTLQSTTDYPPDWMLEKENLKKEYYPVFAKYLVKYVQEYRRHGVNVDYLAPFNEPEFIYCKIRYDQIRELIREHIGPEFEKAGLKTRLQAMESENRRSGAEHIPVILRDPEAKRHIATITAHGYDWDRQGSGPLGKLHELYPGLPVWMTEVCYAKVIDHKPMPVYGFEDGDRWGRMLIADLKHWASGWIYWNMILDQNGGPWLVSIEHHDPEDNPQHPVVIINTDKKEVIYTGLYYYLAHFSKYVRPGAIRIGASGGAPGLEAVAFIAKDGGKIAEVVNSLGAETRFVLQDQGRATVVRLPARSIGTLMWE